MEGIGVASLEAAAVSFGLPTLAGLSDDLMDGLLDIYGHSDAVGDGGIGTGTLALIHSAIPCTIQEMSSSEAQRYKSLVGETLYEVFLPLVSDAGTDIQVKGTDTAWQFQSDGVRYEIISEGVVQSDGLQKVALKRVGTV